MDHISHIDGYFKLFFWIIATRVLAELLANGYVLFATGPDPLNMKQLACHEEWFVSMNLDSWDEIVDDDPVFGNPEVVPAAEWVAIRKEVHPNSADLPLKKQLALLLHSSNEYVPNLPTWAMGVFIFGRLRGNDHMFCGLASSVRTATHDKTGNRVVAGAPGWSDPEGGVSIDPEKDDQAISFVGLAVARTLS